jgi:hypothetical protein
MHVYMYVCMYVCLLEWIIVRSRGTPQEVRKGRNKRGIKLR